MDETPKRIMVGKEEGEKVWMGGMGVDFKLWGNDTGGALSIVEHPIDPGRLVPPHMHTKEDEFSYVIEGEIGARIGNRILQAGPGCYLLKPRDVPHTFWNAGPKKARILEIISPAGFEQFFKKAEAVFAPGADRDQLPPLAGSYEVRLEWWDWVPELTKKYNLKLLGD